MLKPRGSRRSHLLTLAVIAGLAGWLTVAPAPAGQPFDTSRYMLVEEIERGMTGFGRTVIEGTRIETFEFEVISVMHNAFEASQDAILIRASGLNLEHTGIVAGMSGSPCYVVDGQGRERLIGAVAFGWSMGKDPLCGVQPIGQMLDVAEVRDPARRPRPTEPPNDDPAGVFSQGVPIEQFANGCTRLDVQDSRFNFLAEQETIRPSTRQSASGTPVAQTLQPLPVPVAVSGLDMRAIELVQSYFNAAGIMLVATGGAAPSKLDPTHEEVTLEPGSVLSIPLMSGDLNLDAIGTCTDVIGDRVLGFGHGLFSRGFVELPLATGMVHMVFPSVARSFKVGSSLTTVGTIFGDEQTGVFGLQGKVPPLAPLEVTVRDARGLRAFRYEMTRDPQLTPELVLIGVASSIFNRSDLPENHTVRYSVRVDFGELGTFRTSNFTSQVGIGGLFGDLIVPLMTMTRTPFGQAYVNLVAVEVSIEPQAAAAMMHQARLRRDVYRPGETVTVDVEWLNEQTRPTYTQASYALELPADLPDGSYELLVGSASAHLAALRAQRPYEWYASNFSDVLTILNHIGSFPENRLYLHLKLSDVGVALGRTPMPDLPSFRQKILADTGRVDVRPFRESLVVEHDTDFVVQGEKTFTIRVDRGQLY